MRVAKGVVGIQQAAVDTAGAAAQRQRLPTLHYYSSLKHNNTYLGISLHAHYYRHFFISLVVKQ